MANTIRVSIEAIDNLSSVISGSIIKANLLGSAINTAMSVATSAVRQFTNSIGDSINAQQQNISIAGDFARLTGESFTEAGQFIDDFAQRMSAAASSLPGATADYVNLGKGISDNLIPAFKDLNGVFDPEQFQEYLDAISRDGAFRAISSGVDVGNAGLGISKYLGGASIAELSQIKFFEANPAVLAFIEQEAKNLGKELEDLSTRERAEVLRRALAVPDEVIKASQNTISGLVEGFKSTLLDPTSGLFGFMRRLSDGGTALEAITSGLAAVIGEDGLLTAIGETLDALGISFGDPMEGLRSTALIFTARVKYVTGILNDLSEGLGEAGNGLDWDSITNDIFYLLTQIFDIGRLNSILNESGSKVAELVNNLLDGLASLDWGAIGAMSGELLASVLNEGLDFLNGFDFAVLLPLTLRAVDNLLTGVGSFLANVDWGSLLMVGIKVIALNAVYGVASAIAVSIAGAVLSLGAIPAAIIAGIAALVAVIAANWESITSFFSNQWASLTDTIGNNFRVLADFYSQLWSDLTSRVSSTWEGISSSVQNFFSRVQGFFSRITSFIPGIGGASSQPVVNVASRAGGQGLLAGLLDAANTEQRNMPAGSSLVMANSSEAILNRAQQNTLVAALTRSQAPAGLSIANLNVYSAATDAKGIAQDIFQELATQFTRYQQQQLSVGVA